MNNQLVWGRKYAINKDASVSCTQGCFENNRLIGLGTAVYSRNKDKYFGEFKDGLYHGHGTYYFETGSKQQHMIF